MDLESLKMKSHQSTITKSGFEILCTNENFLKELQAMHPEVLLTMGAGDIDQWPEKIARLFKQKN